MQPKCDLAKLSPGRRMWRQRGAIPAFLISSIGAGLALAMQSPESTHREPPAASDELILLPAMLSPLGMRRQLELDVVMRAAVGEHPELIEGPRRDGFYRLDIALNADGSVYRSGIAFFPGEKPNESYFNRFDLHRIIPWGSSTMAGPTIWRGQSVGGVGTAPNSIVINYGFLPVNYDPARAAERLDAPLREKYAELIQPYQGGELNAVTVLMTEDGRIARTHVARIDSNQLREWWTPPPDFSVLGRMPNNSAQTACTPFRAIR